MIHQVNLESPVQGPTECHDVSTDVISDDAGDMNDQSHFRNDAEYKHFQPYKTGIDRDRRVLLNYKKIIRILAS